MKQNMQSLTEQKFNSAQYSYICGDRPANESQRELKGDFTCKPRGTIWPRPLRSDGSRDSQIERLSRMSNGLKQLKEGHQASPLRSDGSHDGREGRLDAVRRWPNALRPKLDLKSTLVRWFSCGSQAGRLNCTIGG